MVSIAISIPDETRQRMKHFPEMNWSGFGRKSIEEKARQLEELEPLRRRLREERPLTERAPRLQHSGGKGRIGGVRKKGLLTTALLTAKGFSTSSGRIPISGNCCRNSPLRS